MESNKEYFAFISYQREDEEWAKWLAHELEHYHLPLTLNGRDDLPQNLRPIFRDIEELSAGNLPHQINQALRNSKHLIVICSPRSAKSPWVNKEIQEFINLGKTDKLFPFIIDGIAMCKNPEDPQECFPPALRNLPNSNERLGANVNENGHGSNMLRVCTDCPIKEDNLKYIKQSDINEKGRDAAVVKIIAGMLGLNFDTLWQRYEREKAEEERKIKEQRDNLLKIQSRYLAEKAKDEEDKRISMLLALEALPKNISHPERPYVAEAEYTIRKIFFPFSEQHLEIERHDMPPVDIHSPIICSPNGQQILSGYSESKKLEELLFMSEDRRKGIDYYIRIWDIKTGNLIKRIKTQSQITHIACSPNGKYLAQSGIDDKIYIWRAYKNSLITVVSGESFCQRFITFTKESKYIVSLEGFGDSVKIWKTDGWEFVANVKSEDELSELLMEIPDLCTVFYKEEIVEDCPLFRKSINYYLCDLSSTIAYPVFRCRTCHSTNFACSPNFDYLATGDGDDIIIYNSNGKVYQRLIGSKGYIRYLSFSPDGSKVISTSDDHIVRIWDVSQGVVIIDYNVPAESAFFTPDGNHIIINNYNISVYSFVSLQKIIHDSFEPYKYKKLTPEERKRFYLE